MNEVLVIGLQAMRGDMARADQIANNLANVLTPGFKRGIAVQAAAGRSGFASSIDAARGQAAAPQTLADLRVQVDRTDGSRKITGQPLDLALSGKGYFEVTTPNGPAFTRLGSFQVDGNGRMVNAAGFPVVGDRGELTLTNRAPKINADGSIEASGTEAAQRLKIVVFGDQDAVRPMGDGLFVSDATPRPADAAEVIVQQGQLENSNVDSAREMTGMVVAMRHFETMQKVVQIADEMLATALRKLGDTA